MNRLLKLVHFELNRFRKIYAALAAVTLLLQFAGLFLAARSYLQRVREEMTLNSLSAASYAAQNRLADFGQFCSNLWFVAPIALGVTVLLLYTFLIWYRDWLGKNVFIYRLLMLPQARANLYLAKLAAIVLMVLGLVAFELAILPLQKLAFNALIPAEFRAESSVTGIIVRHQVLRVLIPPTFPDFLFYYGAGIAGVIVVFTAILIERSYRFKGAVGGILRGSGHCRVSAAGVGVRNLVSRLRIPGRSDRTGNR